MPDIVDNTLDFQGGFEKSTGAVQEKDIGSLIGPDEIKFFREYIGIDEDHIVSHISKARAEAWTAGLQYPSISSLTWLSPYLAHHPARNEVFRRVKAGDSILDCGCMFAPDLRYLAYEGAPTANMIGCDIEGRFFDMAYRYYRDQDRMKATFIATDFFDESPQAPLKRLEGKIDILWVRKFVHLFDKRMQIEVCCNLIKLLKPVPGSLFCLSQNGLPEAREVNIAGVDGQALFKSDTFLLGNEQTSKEIWSEVERRTGTRWDFTCHLLDLRSIGKHEDDGSEFKKITGHDLQWVVRRL